MRPTPNIWPSLPHIWPRQTPGSPTAGISTRKSACSTRNSTGRSPSPSPVAPSRPVPALWKAGPPVRPRAASCSTTSSSPSIASWASARRPTSWTSSSPSACLPTPAGLRRSRDCPEIAGARWRSPFRTWWTSPPACGVSSRSGGRIHGSSGFHSNWGSEPTNTTRKPNSTVSSSGLSARHSRRGIASGT